MVGGPQVGLVNCAPAVPPASVTRGEDTKSFPGALPVGAAAPAGARNAGVALGGPMGPKGPPVPIWIPEGPAWGSPKGLFPEEGFGSPLRRAPPRNAGGLTVLGPGTGSAPEAAGAALVVAAAACGGNV